MITIKNDNNASIIFSMFLKSKDIKYLNAFKEYFKDKYYGSIKFILDDINDLLYEVEGEMILKYIIDNIGLFDYTIKEMIINNIPTIKGCIKLGQAQLLDGIKEDTLFKEYDSSKTVFEYFLENDLLTPQMLSNIYDHTEVVMLIKNKDEKLLTNLSGYILANTNIDDISTIEYLFKQNLVDKKIVNKIYDDAIFDLCNKYNRSDLLPYLSESVLNQEKDGKKIIEILLDNNIYPDLDALYNNDIIKILIDRHLFNYFIDSSEVSLLNVVNGYKTVLDYLLENGLSPSYNSFIQEESLKIFVNHRRFEYATKYSLDVLVSLYNLNDTYLDIILRQKSMGDNINLTLINTYTNNKKNLAKFYISVAKNGFINHVEELDSRALLNNNGELLKELLSIDKDLTLNTILSSNVKEDFDVAVFLKLNGIEQKQVKIDLHSMNLIDDYYKNVNNDFSNRQLKEEEKALINEFREVMLADLLSDKELIEGVISSYTYLISINSVYGINELKKLIELKKSNHQFSFKKSNRGSFYREFDHSIYLENVNLNTINHEIGHALFHELTNKSIPNDYDSILYNLRNSKEVLKKVNDYSLRFQEIKSRVNSFIEENYMKDYHIDEEEKESIESFIQKEKEKHKKDYLEKGYDEETIDIILSGIYNIEDYIEADKRIKKRELMDAILRSEYGAFISIGDIIDSIYQGAFRSEELRNEQGNIIIPCYGHGISYYNKGIEWSFDETMANFSAILKSVDSREILSMLKNIVGEEFINYMESYYINEITLSNKDLSNKEEKAL